MKEFLNTVYSTDDTFNDRPADALNEIWMSLGFRIQSNADSIRKRELELREVVEERNSLIHHWLAEVDFDSVDECRELSSRLDAQDDRLKPHYESLMRQIGHLQTAQEDLQRLVEQELRTILTNRKNNG